MAFVSACPVCAGPAGFHDDGPHAGPLDPGRLGWAPTGAGRDGEWDLSRYADADGRGHVVARQAKTGAAPAGADPTGPVSRAVPRGRPSDEEIARLRADKTARKAAPAG